MLSPNSRARKKACVTAVGRGRRRTDGKAVGVAWHDSSSSEAAKGPGMALTAVTGMATDMAEADEEARVVVEELTLPEFPELPDGKGWSISMRKVQAKKVKEEKKRWEVWNQKVRKREGNCNRHGRKCKGRRKNKAVAGSVARGVGGGRRQRGRVERTRRLRGA